MVLSGETYFAGCAASNFKNDTWVMGSEWVSKGGWYFVFGAWNSFVHVVHRFHASKDFVTRKVQRQAGWLDLGVSFSSLLQAPYILEYIMHGALLLSSKVSKEIDPANPNFLWGSTLGGKKKEKERKLRSVRYRKVQRYTLSQLLHMLSGYWKKFSQNNNSGSHM